MSLVSRRQVASAAAARPRRDVRGGYAGRPTRAAAALSGFPAPPVATTPTTPDGAANTSTRVTGSSAFSSSNALVIVIGAGRDLLGISFFIWRDARRRAPVREVAGGDRRAAAKPGSKAPPKPRKLSPAERRRRKRGRAKR